MGRFLICIHTCVKVFLIIMKYIICNICSHASQLMGCTDVLSKTHRPVAWLVCGCHSYKLHWDLLVHWWWISCPYTVLYINKNELKGPEQQVVWATTYCRIYMLNMLHWIRKGLWNTISMGHNQLLKRIWVFKQLKWIAPLLLLLPLPVSWHAWPNLPPYSSVWYIFFSPILQMVSRRSKHRKHSHLHINRTRRLRAE